MKIEKLQYSSRPWRLMKNGQEFWVPTVFDHPVSGKILIDEPLAGDTKKELIDNILRAFDQLIAHVNANPALDLTRDKSSLRRSTE